MYENKIIHNGIAYKTGLDLRTFWHGDVRRFKSHGRIRELKNIILHENVGSTNYKTIEKTLLGKDGGYHFMVQPSGCITQHADTMDYLYHGNRMNRYGVGICAINPYSPKLLKLKDYENYTVVESSWWTHGTGYCQPKDKQMEALYKLVTELCKFGIPFKFPTLDRGPHKRKYRRWEKIGPGIVAHGDYSKHADGRYQLEWIMDKGCPTCQGSAD